MDTKDLSDSQLKALLVKAQKELARRTHSAEVAKVLETLKDRDGFINLYNDMACEVWTDAGEEALRIALLGKGAKAHQVDAVIDAMGEASNCRDELQGMDDEASDYFEMEQHLDHSYDKGFKLLEKLLGATPTRK